MKLDPVAIARELYEGTASLPLICPHGHVDPRLFADPDATFQVRRYGGRVEQDVLHFREFNFAA